MRRFYKQVDVAAANGGWQVTLDGRGVKTVKGLPQIVPTEALARALAAEWDAQGEKIDAQSLPLRDMTDYAIDIVAPDQAAVVEKIVAYGDTDTLLYRADPDEPLYARQHLDPKGRWIDLMTEASILPVNKRPRLAIRLHTSN